MHGSLCQALFEIVRRASNDVLHAAYEEYSLKRHEY